MATPTQHIYKYLDSLLTGIRVLAALRHGRPQSPEPSHEHTLHLLANGPSLKKLSITELQGDKLALNLFASTEMYPSVKPAHYVILSPAFWPSGPLQQAGKPHQQALQDIVDKTSWPMYLHIPRKSGTYIKEFTQSNPHVKTLYYADTPVEGLTTINHLLFDWKMGMPRPHNVLIASLMISIWAQYKTIFLHGVDHSWLPLIYVDENNNALLEQKHFYDEGKTKARPMTTAGNDDNRRKLHEMLEKFYLTFRAYHIIEAYAKRQGVRIVTCTKGSYIDAFERGQPNT